MRIAIINGPNLNLLGKRETDIYGSDSFESFYKKLKSEFSDHDIRYTQSNHEGELVDHIQQLGFDSDAVIINPAAYTHTSVAIRDALAAVPAKVIEVHISNIYSRETFRHHSYVSAVASGVISGFGLNGYRLAINHLLHESD